MVKRDEEYRWPLEAGKGKGMDFLEPPLGGSADTSF